MVLAEFGDTRHSAFPDGGSDGAPRFDGPLHNEIPKPDRETDNSTLWQANYDRGHFKDMYFNRMRSSTRTSPAGSTPSTATSPRG